MTGAIEHTERMVAESHGADWVFCDGEGGSLRKSNVLRRSFKSLVRNAGLPSIRFHDVRHNTELRRSPRLWPSHLDDH